MKIYPDTMRNLRVVDARWSVALNQFSLVFSDGQSHHVMHFDMDEGLALCAHINGVIRDKQKADAAAQEEIAQ